MTWKRWLALITLALMVPGTLTAGPILECIFGYTPSDYSCCHYWLPGYYRWSAYLHPVNLSIAVTPSTELPQKNMSGDTEQTPIDVAPQALPQATPPILMPPTP